MTVTCEVEKKIKEKERGSKVERGMKRGRHREKERGGKTGKVRKRRK